MAIPIMIYNSLTLFQAIPTISSPIAAGVSNKQEKIALTNFYLFKIHSINCTFNVIGMLGG